MKVEVESPYKLKEILFTRNYPGYIYRRELIDDLDHGGNGRLPMVNCYSSDTGHWLGGGSKTARLLCKKFGLRQIQKADKKHCVASIGFNKDEQKWYGWSHRAMCAFGIGDMLFEEKFGNDHTLFIEHGSEKIKTLEQAKQAAINFAAHVS